MRRPIGVMIIGVLVLALGPSIAFASPNESFSATDFRAAIFARLFGETTDGRASIAASFGDRASESMLRNYALRVSLEPAAPAAGGFEFEGLALESPQSGETEAPYAYSEPGLTAELPDLSIAEPGYDVSVEQPVEAVYQPLAPAPRVTAEPGSSNLQFGQHLSPNEPPLVTFTPVFSPVHGFDAGTSGISPPSTFTPADEASITVPVPVRVGNARVQTRFEGAQAQAPELSLSDQALGAGANFDIRAGARSVNVDVSSSFEHLTRNDGTLFASSGFDSTSTVQVPDGSAPIMLPAFADVSKHTVTTGVAVPLSRALSVGVQYDAQHLQGGYGAIGLSNLDADTNSYGANLTYNLPHTSSLITVSAKQYLYRDNLVPLNTFTQTSTAVNFTVKF